LADYFVVCIAEERGHLTIREPDDPGAIDDDYRIGSRIQRAAGKVRRDRLHWQAPLSHQALRPPIHDIAGLVCCMHNERRISGHGAGARLIAFPNGPPPGRAPAISSPIRWHSALEVPSLIPALCPAPRHGNPRRWAGSPSKASTGVCSTEQMVLRSWNTIHTMEHRAMLFVG